MNIFEKYIWNTIKFYLQHSPLELRYANVSFSQFGEDIIFDNLFNKTNGFYVDVGAYHPFNFSNTYLLYKKKGWNGINIEPNPIGFSLLQRFRKRDTNLQLGVSDSPGEVVFLDDRTYSKIMAPEEPKEAGKNYITIQVKRLEDILEETLEKGQTVDFLTVDCEGHDLKVLQSNNWDKIRPTLVAIEDHGPYSESEAASYMKDIGYNFLLRIGLTRIFVEQDQTEIVT